MFFARINLPKETTPSTLLEGQDPGIEPASNLFGRLPGGAQQPVPRLLPLRPSLLIVSAG